MDESRIIDLDVAVIGGGFAGVYCAKALRKRLGRRPGLSMALIADNNYMVFQPMLAEVVGGGLSARHVINPLRKLCKGLKVIKSGVENIDLAKHELILRPGKYSDTRVVKFRHLVLAVGAEIDISRVPGMPEHAFLMQTAGDAMKLHAAVISRCEEASLEPSPHVRRRMLTFTIVGGGYSGVETAGQILDLLNSVHKSYHLIESSDYRVVLVHSRNRLLPTLSEDLSLYAEKKLRSAGLQLVLNTHVSAVTANSVYLTDGDEIACNTVVCTVGNAPHSLIRRLCETFEIENDNGRIITDTHMAVTGHANLWAAGDCARVPIGDGEYCPPTAQFAMRQGTLCGGNVANTIDNLPLVPFSFKGMGELAAIGRRDAVANIMGVKLSGFMAWWIWRTIYLSKLPGVERRLRVTLDWTLDLFFPRDVNLLSPEQTEVVNRIHLEAGDRLCNAGEPAFSLYFVVNGKIDLWDQGRVVKSIGSGEYFGERELTKNLPFIYDAQAAEATEVSSLDAKVFTSLLSASTILQRIFKRTATQYKTEEEMRILKERVQPAIANATAQDVMQSNLIVLKQDESIGKNLNLIKLHRHSSYPLVDISRRYVGTLSRADLFFALKSSSIPLETRFRDLDYRQLPIVPHECAAAEILEMMLTRGINKVMVNNKDGKLAGIVTLLDLICEEGTDARDT